MDQGAIPHTRTSPTLPATEKPAAPRGKHGLPAPPPVNEAAAPALSEIADDGRSSTGRPSRMASIRQEEGPQGRRQAEGLPAGTTRLPIPSGGARPHGPAEEVRAEGDMVLLVCVGQEIPDHHRRPAGDRNLHPYPLKHPLHRGRPSRRQPCTGDIGRRARVLRTYHIRVIPHIIWFLNCNC